MLPFTVGTHLFLYLILGTQQVTKLMEQVEAIFISHFSGDDKRSAMRSLRPVRVAASHSVTFFLGILVCRTRISYSCTSCVRCSCGASFVYVI